MYEFLWDFCYGCGIIGHTEKLCTEKSEKGTQPQYDKKLRYVHSKRIFDNDRGSRMRGGLRQHFVPSRPHEQRAGFLRWRGGGSSRGSGGSDAPSWRKDQQTISGNTDKSGEGKEMEEEVQSCQWPFAFFVF